MVQQFTNSFKWFWNKTDKYVIMLMTLLSFILFFLFKKFHLTDAISLNQLLNNLIQFSGIFSAIIITYVVSKVFQVRQERIEQRKEIVDLSNKVTDFRRIARVLIQCHNFWDSTMRNKMNGEYKAIDYFLIKDWDYENQNKKSLRGLRELRDKFFDDSGVNGAYLYLDLKSLILEDYDNFHLDLYNRFDNDNTYSFDILQKWVRCNSGNTLWYCFSHKRHAYRDTFDLTAIRRHEEQEILHLAKKIDPEKFGNSKFDGDLLGDVAGDMDSFYLPRLYDLTYYNTLGLSGTLNFLLSILFLTIVSGVFVPLFLTSIKMDLDILMIASSISTSILCLSLFYFLLKFKKILNNEIRIG